MDVEFPEEVYVQRFNWKYEGDKALEDDNYIVASETKEEIFEQDLGNNTAGEFVGIYKLVRVVEMSRTIRQPLYKEKKILKGPTNIK